MLRTALIAALASGGLVACTAAGNAAPTTQTVQVTTTVPAPSSAPASPSALPTGAISAGPTLSADGTCPLLSKDAAADALGQRLDRIAVQTVGGKVVGCQFFDIQGGSLATSEHLSGPNQPALQISSASYATTTLAHNAMVLASRVDPNAHTFNGGIAFQNSFDPADGKSDWAYAFVKGTTLILIETNTPDSELDAEAVATAIAGKF
jgi:hypothetical protein